MTLNYDCGNNEALVTYLYDECEPGEREAVAAHLAVCSRCADELASLRGTRSGLAAWAPPDARLGFRVEDEIVPATVMRPSRWWARPLPAWAQAAAALLIFVTGAGLGALRGTTREPAATPAASSATVAAPASVTRQDLAALEQQLRAEMQRTASVPAPVSQRTAAVATGGATLEQVRQLIAESEQRQQREVKLRTAEVIRDFDTQRRGDLARIQQAIGRVEGTTDAAVEQQRQTLNLLMRVSQQQPGR
jgi:hypothetical protein